jgi:ring-1,2-phenylacetyl-CoA epoxidase subunit PaaE
MPPKTRRSVTDTGASREPAGSRRAPSVHQLQVAAVESLTGDAVSITFEVPDELREVYRFRAGQHVTLICSDGREELRRTYSICSRVGGPLMVAVKCQPGGRFSSWVQESLRPGDRLGVMTPTGRFSLELLPSQEKFYVCVAAGSGVTPVLSNIATALELERRSRVVLLYLNRTEGETMFFRELQLLSEQHPQRLSVHHLFSRGENGGGRITKERFVELTQRVAPVGSVDDWMLCGPSSLTHELTATLAELGVAPARVHRETFTAEESEEDPNQAAEAVESDVTVVMNGETVSLRLQPSQGTILDGLLPLRPETPYACRDGVCTSCRARLTRGHVTMRRSSALDADELAAGYVLVCQARPTSPQVVVNFDAQ